jgi:hypothetical protein
MAPSFLNRKGVFTEGLISLFYVLRAAVAQERESIHRVWPEHGMFLLWLSGSKDKKGPTLNMIGKGLVQQADVGFWTKGIQ